MRDFLRISVKLSWSICLLVFVMLAGCAPNTIKGTEKKYDITLNIHSNSGPVTLTSPLRVEALSETTQNADPSTVISPETAMAMPSGGSTASIAAQAASQSLKDIASKALNDLSKKNSDNPTTNTTTNPQTTAPIITPTQNKIIKDGDKEASTSGQVDTGQEQTSDDIEYKNKATFTSYGVRNGGRQAWRIAGKGPSFGEPVKFVFSSGKTFTVADTDKNCRDREDTCARDSSSGTYGFVFKPGIGPNGEGDSDTGTSHGGIYLHAPYKDSSQTVTIYYNKP